MADKQAIEQRLDAAWAELLGLVQKVPEDAVTRPGVVEDWSLKDLLGHIAFWSGRAARTLRCTAAGRPEDAEFGDGEDWVDAWNAREFEARKDHEFHQVRAEWMRNHEDVCKALDDAPAEAFDIKLRGGYSVLENFAGDTFMHYSEHAQHIRNWLREMETSET
jgi:uncharacterized protein (TIGR03083 family)